MTCNETILPRRVGPSTQGPSESCCWSFSHFSGSACLSELGFFKPYLPTVLCHFSFAVDTWMAVPSALGGLPTVLLALSPPLIRVPLLVWNWMLRAGGDPAEMRGLWLIWTRRGGTEGAGAVDPVCRWGVSCAQTHFWCFWRLRRAQAIRVRLSGCNCKARG